MMKKFLSVIAVIFISSSVFAQDIPIGSWKEYLPYANPIGVTQSDDKVFCITALSMFSVTKSDNSITHYSKISGLSDIGFSCILYDKINDVTLIAYSNSNIDLLRGSDITNISDIKRKNTIGDKSIYCIAFNGAFAYLGCGFGIVVIDLNKNEIKDSYHFGANGTDVKVNAITFQNNFIYAATDNGVFRADITNPDLVNYNNWTHYLSVVPTTAIVAITSFSNNIYAATDSTLYAFDGTNWSFLFSRTGLRVTHLYSTTQKIIISSTTSSFSPGRVYFMDNVAIIDSLFDPSHILYPRQTVYDAVNNTYWCADESRGLCKVFGGIYSNIIPNGPGSSHVWDLNIHDGELNVAPGALDANGNYAFNIEGFFILRSSDDQWFSYNRSGIPALDTIYDYIVTTHNKRTQKTYFGSFGGGLLEASLNNPWNFYKQNSSLQPASGDPGSYRISGLAADDDGNLWIANQAAPKPISVMKPDGTWKSFLPTVAVPNNEVGSICIDRNNFKWIATRKGHGILVFDSGENPDDITDDRYKLLTKGTGAGNLPNDQVNAIVEDKNGDLWIGTATGVAVFYCSGNVFDNGGCDAQQILVKQDAYYGYLLATENVTCMAVDGANRKWVGTANGVFLLSDDGTNQLAHFTIDNSPLFSNSIVDIAIDDVSGEVYIGTEKGIEVYRGQATEALENNCEAIVFPNPVRQNYTGDIAISNLPYNCEVRITDVTGNLVFKTTALGGQAIWNGNKLDGNRVATGVYYVFSSNTDGTNKCITKVLVVN